MQNEIVSPIQVPGKSGLIENPGWARTEVMKYTRENIRAPWFRRKEWDYYLFTTRDFAVALTISDLGYIGLLSASFLDLRTAKEHTETEILPLTRGKAFGLGTEVKDAHGEAHSKRLDLTYANEGDRRRIRCEFRNFDGDKALKADLAVYEPDMEAMYIATPWKEKPTAFYYNCKRNCLEAEGTVTYGDRVCRVTRDTCSGVLDWGRGVWTYDNTWYWGTGSGRVNGEPFGINLGYGFSDRSAASENAVYFRGKIHKLANVEFRIGKTPEGKPAYGEPWNVTDDEGRFSAVFNPILVRKADMDYGVIATHQHQVFGLMTGSAVLDSGETLPFSDLVCALEIVRNKY